MKHDRARLHRVVGEAIERTYPDRLDENAARLARHYAEAGEDAKTFQFSVRAGDVAARVNANPEAIRHCTRALETAERLAIEPEALTAV